MSAAGSRRALAGLLDLVDRPALIVAPDGEILFANAAASRLCGVSAAGLPGLSLPEALGMEDGAELLRGLREDVPGPAAAAERHSVVTVVSARRDLRLLVRPVPPGGSGEPRGVVVLGDAAPTEAGTAGLPGDHFARLAHELRQPVQAALGYSELLSTGIFGALTAEQEDAARRVHELIGRLARMLEGLLQRPEGGRPAP